MGGLTWGFGRFGVWIWKKGTLKAWSSQIQSTLSPERRLHSYRSKPRCLQSRLWVALDLTPVGLRFGAEHLPIFDEQVVVNTPNIPGVTRLPLESFLVRTQLKPVEPLLWPSVKIYLPYVAATPFMLSPLVFPADPAAPRALPQPLQVLSSFGS